MCGICGLVNFKKQYSRERRHDIVHSMNDTIIHRGPDSEGIYDGEWLTMGMRRLSIIDLNTGSQPMYSSSGSKILVFNGEIYNYIELKKKLEKKGYSFQTSSDTEVAANLFEEYGTASFEMLDGMFAMAIYDTEQRMLYLVRDRMGEKPLYYYVDKEKMLFGSELKCLQITGMIPTELNIAALNFFFQYTYIPAPLSIYKNVYKLLPGHYMKVSERGEVTDECFWRLEKNDDYASLSYEEAKEELFRRVNESVKIRMRSDVPVGAFLSGGLDSGTIVALMARNSQTPINTYTIGLKTEQDESQRAKRMAEHVGTHHTNFVLDYGDSISVVSDIAEHMDEPFADPSCIPEYLVSKLASDHVKVVLTGDAGDEILLGYNKYLINYYADRYLKIPKVFRKGVIEPIISKLPDKSYFSMKVGKVINSAGGNTFQRRNRMMQQGYKDEESIKLFCERYFDLSGQNLITEMYEKACGSDIDKTQFVDLHLVLEGDMLAKVDRMSMLNSLETRTPLLANDLVEFAYSLPADYKLSGKVTKRIMKDTFKDLFPEGYEKLPKSGFSVPVDEWFRNEMREELLDITNETRIRQQGLFEYDYVCSVIKEHMAGRVNRKNEIWSMYVFQKWYEAQKVYSGRDR